MKSGTGSRSANPVTDKSTTKVAAPGARSSMSSPGVRLDRIQIAIEAVEARVIRPPSREAVQLIRDDLRAFFGRHP